MGRKAYYTTPDELYAKLEEYRLECEKEKTPFTLTGLVIFLGFKNKKSYYDQAARTENEYEDGYTWAEVVDYGSLLFEHEHEKGLHKGNNTGGHIFGLKNAGRKVVDGWSDKVSHEVSGPNEGPIRYADLDDEQLENEIRRLAAETGLGEIAGGEEEA